MEALLYCGCGLDIHKEVIEACILRGLDAEPEIIRQSFGTAKPELRRLMDWLGEKKAIIAIARKLLRLIYLLLSRNQMYQPPALMHQ